MVRTETIDGGLKQRLSGRVDQIEAAMAGFLRGDGQIPERLREAMLYSLAAGGKRLRPAMVVLACEACGGEMDDALAAAAAIEMVHTFSLIHDDLPAMDDDDLRRGQATNHKVFGEAMAILAGDGLLCHAFGTIAKYVDDGERVRSLVAELAQGSGASGMVGGQVLDMVSEHQAADLAKVREIHTYKTAMLFRAALRMGAVCAGGEAAVVEKLGDYGLKIGLAFQIVDDLLDLSGTANELGKETQKDGVAGKLTWPGVAGVEAAGDEVERLVEEAVAAIEGLGCDGEHLRELAVWLIERKN
jgi:geranylgeranyl diphosphate synthase type II